VRISTTGSVWRPALASSLLLGLVLVVQGCKDPNKPGPVQVTDFTLPDVNPNSATYDQPVGPRLYLNQVSAWYFGHAT